MYFFKLELHLVKLSFHYNAKLCTHSRNILLIFRFIHWCSITYVNFREFNSLELCEKWPRKARICVLNSLLWCVVMNRRIFEVRLMCFKPCFYMVVIHSGGNTHIVYELQAYLIFLYGLASTMITKNTQLVDMPYKTQVTAVPNPILKFYTRYASVSREFICATKSAHSGHLGGNRVNFL